MSITLHYDQSAAFTDAFALIAEGWNEVVQAGYSPDRVGIPPFSARSQVIYATSHDGEIIGVLLFDEHHELKQIELVLAYVEHSSRKKGLFRQMLLRLVEMSRERGIRRISVKVGSSNAEFESILVSLKILEASRLYEIDL